MKIGTALSAGAALATLFVLFVPHWHHPVDGHQQSYRGQGMVQFDNAEPQVALVNRPPAPPPPDRWGITGAALADTRPAAEAFHNLQVVKDGTAGDFMKLHVAITQWVAPQQGCAFCHQGGDFASDAKPQKQAARDMLRMTRTLNADWQPHVGPSGVTCFTCHRGQNVPQFMWYPAAAPQKSPFIAKQEPWHEAASTVRDFFPDAGYAEYLLQDTKARGSSYTALPTTGAPAPIEVVRLYEVMMQMSDGIGVNCGFCHDSRAFYDWSQSTPARWTGLSGIHMTRAINAGTLLPLAHTIPQIRTQVPDPKPPAMPASESGPQNGNGLATCATCHYGSPKPLDGLNLMADFPGLKGAIP